MQREIKFRAYDKRTKYIAELQGFKYVGDKSIQLFYKDEDGCSTTYTCDKEFIVLMQYTGLHDKNGKEIYEGDILKEYPNNSVYVGKVYYEDAQWFGACDYLNYAVVYSGAEVIGNIYENPELLEVSE